jgi:hypothetical protein
MPQLLRYFMSLSADYDPDDSWFDDRIRETPAEVLAELRESPGVATNARVQWPGLARPKKPLV